MLTRNLRAGAIKFWSVCLINPKSTCALVFCTGCILQHAFWQGIHLRAALESESARHRARGSLTRRGLRFKAARAHQFSSYLARTTLIFHCFKTFLLDTALSSVRLLSKSCVQRYCRPWLIYLSPPSHKIVTTTDPGDNSRASCKAANTFAAVVLSI